MKTMRSIMLLSFFSVSITLFAQEVKPIPPPPPAQPGATHALPPEITNNCIVLVNAAGISADQFESVRSFAEKDLWIKVSGITDQAEWGLLPTKASTLMAGNHKVVVVLGTGPSNGQTIVAAPDNQWAIVNISFFTTKDADASKQIQRLRQGAMRGIGYALGLSTCPDAHCVMHILRDQSVLNEIGNNYCGPTRQNYLGSAISHGLRPIPPLTLKKMQLKNASQKVTP